MSERVVADAAILLCMHESSRDASSGAAQQRVRYLPLGRSRLTLEAGVSATTALHAPWPGQQIPVEVFQEITKYVSRDDIKAMRLVNREFETKLSGPFFYASVVPFNAELYDMLDGVDVAVAGPASLIRKFGISFEVTEEQLARIPAEDEQAEMTPLSGVAYWPQQQAGRFAALEELETLAEDTARMKKAFSKLVAVKELALSIDSGMGWLNGPDRSVRARIFPNVSPVFGPQCSADSRHMSEAKAFWTSLHSTDTNGLDYVPTNAVFQITPTPVGSLEFMAVGAKPIKDPNTWLSVAAQLDLPLRTDNTNHALANVGMLVITSGDPDRIRTGALSEPALIPAELKKEQMQWLRETEWAQQAFLQSYILAVVDMPTTFATVETLTLAKIPTSLLAVLGATNFWDALPALGTVTILALAEWRKIEKDTAGDLCSVPQLPSDGVGVFFRTLLTTVVARESIKSLNIGWSGGGEHAEGIFARNAHLLPAPIHPMHQMCQLDPLDGLVFPHVEHLTLTNCWVTPPALEGLIKNHSDLSLRKVTLNSVSLTMDPRTTFIDPLNEDGELDEQPWDVHFGGSWPDVINIISPGIIFADIEGASTGPPPERRRTALRELEFISCGYTRLPKAGRYAHIYLDSISSNAQHEWSWWFEWRREGLLPLMMQTSGIHLGEIIQYFPDTEMDALEKAWGMRWSDNPMAEAAEFDGYSPGGTGRFSGRIEALSDSL